MLPYNHLMNLQVIPFRARLELVLMAELISGQVYHGLLMKEIIIILAQVALAQVVLLIRLVAVNDLGIW